tara:strand:+ start:645 stop:920 length:276 start_codon:yes stop_codon:yes gene_type:complete
MKTKYKLGQVLKYNCSLSLDEIIIVGIEKAKDDTVFYAVVNLDVIDNKKNETAVYYEPADDIDGWNNDQVYKVWNTYGEYLEEQNKNFLNK